MVNLKNWKTFNYKDVDSSEQVVSESSDFGYKQFAQDQDLDFWLWDEKRRNKWNWKKEGGQLWTSSWVSSFNDDSSLQTISSNDDSDWTDSARKVDEDSQGSKKKLKKYKKEKKA